VLAGKGPHCRARERSRGREGMAEKIKDPLPKKEGNRGGGKTVER